MNRLVAFCRRELSPWTDDLGLVALVLFVAVFVPHLIGSLAQ